MHVDRQKESGVKRQVSWRLATGAARRTTQNQWFGEIFAGQTEKMERNPAHRLFHCSSLFSHTANRWGLSSPFQDIPAQSSPGFMWRGLSAFNPLNYNLTSTAQPRWPWNACYSLKKTPAELWAYTYWAGLSDCCDCGFTWKKHQVHFYPT